METLYQIIKNSEENKTAIGHFNISNLEQLKAIFEAGQELSKSQSASWRTKIPLIIGTSEGERTFIGINQAVALIRSFKEEFNYPIFLNADHVHSLEGAKKTAMAGYDAITFDASDLPFEENIKKTREAVEIIKSINPEILVEGEIGYIGGSSKILKEIPKGAAVNLEDLTKPEQANRFIKETKANLLAPAVGNIHGMFENMPNPDLNIQRIKEIREAADVPLVLHGGSGIKKEDFLAAIDAGISIIHINTEIRWAWRRALEKSLQDNPEEIAPYKVMPEVIAEMKKVVAEKLKIFNKYL